MILESVRRVPLVLLLALLLLPLPARAQEAAGEETEERLKKLLLYFEAWVAQPAGMQYEPATESNFANENPFDTQVIGTSFGTETDGRYGLGFQGQWGKIFLTYWSYHVDTAQSRTSPGEYVFGEIAAYPLYAGVNNDGLADGFSSNTSTSMRDYRIDFSRKAFRTPKIRGEWLIGWRRVSHRRIMTASYFSIVSPLPPLLPPVADCGIEVPLPGGNSTFVCPLDPLPDLVEVRSEFNGRGPTGGLNVDFLLLRDKLVFETGLDMTVMRGDIDTSYEAINQVYACVTSFAGFCEAGDILGPPYAILNEVDGAAAVSQEALGIGLNSTSQSNTSLVTDVRLGFRYSALRWMDLTVGFRSSRYTDVGLDVRPKITTFSPDVDGFVINSQDVTSVSRSVTFEGFYLALTFKAF